MYKCSECGTEYEIMPKYCNCGNDIFIDIEDNNDFEVSEISDFQEDDEEEIISARTRNFKQKTFSPYAIIIFALCIILSILVLFVIGNPKQDISEQKSNSETAEKIEIPSIESYWDDAKIKITEEESPQEESILDIMPKIVQQIIPHEQPQKEIPTVATIKKTPNASAQKNTKTIKSVPITSTPQNQAKTPSKLASQPSSKTNSTETTMTFEDLTNKIRNQYSNQNNTTSGTQTNQTTKSSSPQTTVTVQPSQINNNNITNLPPSNVKTNSNSTNTNTNVTTTTNNSVSQQINSVPVQTVPQKPIKTEAQLKQELTAYKSGLRNLIGKKIDFTRVIGDGECILTFKVNSGGRLTSKAFVSQSSNITLNDAVFNALNTTTTYNPPPEAYKGETLKLTIKFYNGNFEISLN